MQLSVTLPWPPAVLNPNKRVHWAVKAKSAKAYRLACYALARNAGLRSIPWDGEIHVMVTFYLPDRRHRDDDNYIAAFKSGRDGLADALGVSDNRFRMHPVTSSELGGMVKVLFARDYVGANSAPPRGNQI